MSIRAFAAHLGISERMVSKWEAGGANVIPRPVNQAALDTSLAASSADVHARFISFTSATPGAIPAQPQPERTPVPTEAHQVRHPVDGKLMTLIEEGVFLSGPNNEPVWLPAYYIDVFP